MPYKQYMTTEYDEQFQSVPDLKWNPWVGKNYHKTGILILGMSTDARDEGWKEAADKNANASRQIVAWVNSENDEPFDYESDPRHTRSFKNTTQMFIEAADGKQNNKENRAAFWELVAFNNFVQDVVKKDTQIWDVDKEIFSRSYDALTATINIIQPKLILVWGVAVLDRIGVCGTINVEKTNGLLGSKKNGARPRICAGEDGRPPMVGIQHPSALVGANHQKEWLGFLCNEPLSKKPINDFLQHLNNTIK